MNDKTMREEFESLVRGEMSHPNLEPCPSGGEKYDLESRNWWWKIYQAGAAWQSQQAQGEMPPVPYNEHERALEEELEARDYWHDKATELAERVGDHFGFDVGEHTSANCPVQNALDADWFRQAQREAVKIHQTPEWPVVGFDHLVRFDGTWQFQTYRFDQGDDGVGGGEYFWDRDDVDEGRPFNPTNDAWINPSEIGAPPAPAAVPEQQAKIESLEMDLAIAQHQLRVLPQLLGDGGAAAVPGDWRERLIADYRAQYVGQGIESWIRGLPDSLIAATPQTAAAAVPDYLSIADQVAGLKVTDDGVAGRGYNKAMDDVLALISLFYSTESPAGPDSEE